MFLRPFRMCLTATVAVSLMAALFPFAAALAADAAVWAPVRLPADGASGGWVLAAGADTRYLTAAIDGTLYCYATPAATTDTLFKSTDGGLTWSTTGRVKDAIIAIVAAPFDAATVYYATTSRIYRSTDAGASFIPLPPNPGGAGSGNVQITSLDVARPGAGNLVAVSTRDTDAGQFGGVYFLDENTAEGVWRDASAGNYDILRVAFSPLYASDRMLFAIATDETDTVVKTKLGDGGWGQTIADGRLTGIVPTSAAIVFPADYQPQGNCYIGINTGANHGDVCKVTFQLSPSPSSVARLGIGDSEGLTSIDINSLICTQDTGDTTLVAGLARQARTYTSFDGGAHWSPCQKPPSGQADTWLTATGAQGQVKVYAVTSGTESAFSVSADGGMTWSQTALVDTKISRLIDFAVGQTSNAASPVFLITHSTDSAKRNLWRSQDSGAHWQRVFSAGLPGVDTINLVTATTDGALFLAGQGNGAPILWTSVDMGQTFAMRMAPCDVTAWAFADRNTFFVGGYDGSKGLVYGTSNGGMFYSEPAEAGAVAIANIAISPDYPQGRTLAAGDTNGRVFLSTNNGGIFRQLGQQLPVSAGVGNVSVVFDRDFLRNGNVYAAVDTKTTTTSKERLFRFGIGRSTAWQSIAGALPVDALLKQIAMTPGGVLYAVNTQPVAAADAKGGVMRCINPAVAVPSWETVVGGLDEGAKLSGMWPYQGQLWSTDIQSTALMTLADTLTESVALNSPADGTSGLKTDVPLDWQAVRGATEYEWQVSADTSFASLPAGSSGTTSSNSARATSLSPSTTYYWRVRATRPFHSPWSAVWSFLTLVGGVGVAPELSLPGAGARTALTPIFQWIPVTGADRYELLVATDTAFASPVIVRTDDAALMANAWQCDVSLNYETTYFWKVRACTANNYGDWSAVSVFTTEAAPTVPPLDGADSTIRTQTPVQQVTIVAPQTQAATPPPAPVTVQFPIPEWTIISGLALLMAIAVLLAAILVALIRRRG